ncbi:MAG TPA: hypothetical protein VFQ44_15095 [Streptosporangiaceae bacterium]|nr:hypothetical protein [Streptosporangiaceae bacterium]
MNQLDLAREKMSAAASLGEVLAAAYAGFVTMLPVIEYHQDPASSDFVTFVIAGETASTCRLALVAAPSLPDSSRSAAIARCQSRGRTTAEVTAGLASLCHVMASRLCAAALTAIDAEDREACSRTSYHARQLCAWFGGEPAR